VLRNTLGEDDSSCRLLRCVRTYVELDMLASLEVHSDLTIEYGRETAKKFFKLAHVRRNFPCLKLILLLIFFNTSGVQKGGMEISEDAPHQTSFRRHPGQGCHAKFYE
jgi:hypothetical protein